MWLSSLTDSTAKGKPDIEAVDVSARMQTVSDIVEVTTKPIVFDGDTGGKPEHFVFTVKTLERLGVSAVVIEDKHGLKRNSLFGTGAGSAPGHDRGVLPPDRRGQEGTGHRRLHDHRAHREPHPRGGDGGRASRGRRRTSTAGADGIMIHSCASEPDEILEFADRYTAFPSACRSSSSRRRTTPSARTSSRRPASTSSSTRTSSCAAPTRRCRRRPVRSSSTAARSRADDELLPIGEVLRLIPGGA